MRRHDAMGGSRSRAGEARMDGRCVEVLVELPRFDRSMLIAASSRSIRCASKFQPDALKMQIFVGDWKYDTFLRGKWNL
jgi:hypothetical protein